MKGWEIKDFFWKVQEEALAGNSEEIDRFTSQYSLSCVNADYSLFVIIRQFHVQLWGDERRILNCEPGTYGGQPSDAQQWGITISRYNIEDGGLKISLCIPNYSYTGVTCNAAGEITISFEQQTIVTNEIELKRKLKFIAGKHSEQEILDAFNSLCNEQYDISTPEVVYTTLESTEAGTMTYDEEMKCYKGSITIADKTVSVHLPLAEAVELPKMMSAMDKQLKGKFYEKAMQAMYSTMIKLKNEVWLGEDEDGNEEPPLTSEEFAERVTISSISFYEDGSATIYCEDGDVFFGHWILIETDRNAIYQKSNLAG